MRTATLGLEDCNSAAAGTAYMTSCVDKGTSHRLQSSAWCLCEEVAKASVEYPQWLSDSIKVTVWEVRMVGLRKGPNGCNGATLGCQALDALTINCEPMPSLDTDRALSPRTWHDKGHEEPLGYGTNWQIGVSLCGAGPGIASCKGCPCDAFRPSPLMPQRGLRASSGRTSTRSDETLGMR